MPSSPLRTLILYTRFPASGTTKTRLIPALGAEGAADLHRKLTEGVLGRAAAFCTRCGVTLEIHFRGGSGEAMRHWLGPHRFVFQTHGHLGERMNHSFASAFAAGAQQAVIIGSDCPGITADILFQAFAALEKAALVLGPSRDGGYYLIGLSSPMPFLFRDIDWGSPQVFSQTLARASALAVHQLPPLHDIDRPADLIHLDHYSHQE